MLAPLRETVPALTLVRPPLPLTAPDSVNVKAAPMLAVVARVTLPGRVGLPELLNKAPTSPAAPPAP